MVKGVFGIFDGVDLIAEFGNDVDAEEEREALLELHVPEGFRRPAYDDLQVYEKPDAYDPLHKVLVRLRKARNEDLAVVRCLRILQAAQADRAEVRRAAS